MKCYLKLPNFSFRKTLKFCCIDAFRSLEPVFVKLLCFAIYGSSNAAPVRSKCLIKKIVLCSTDLFSRFFLVRPSVVIVQSQHNSVHNCLVGRSCILGSTTSAGHLKRYLINTFYFAFLTFLASVI